MINRVNEMDKIIAREQSATLESDQDGNAMGEDGWEMSKP
jgi:hypothetical protein